MKGETESEGGEGEGKAGEKYMDREKERKKENE